MPHYRQREKRGHNRHNKQQRRKFYQQNQVNSQQTPIKVDVSLQCNLTTSNTQSISQVIKSEEEQAQSGGGVGATGVTSSQEPNQIDPDSDSGYCSPKQRGPSGDKCPDQLEVHLESQNNTSETQTKNSPPSYSQILKGQETNSTTDNNNNPVTDQADVLTLTDCESSEALLNRRHGKKAFRAQQKADLEYAEIQEEQKKLERRLYNSSLMEKQAQQGSARKKGKIRETPKQKKPTPLKRVILKEREEKKATRDQQANAVLEPNCDVPALPPILDGIAGPESEIQSVVEASRIHSRRFREYCDQVIDKQIDELAAFILSELNRFYQRQLQKNQIKAKSKRRFVLGIREVFKHLKLGKIKCVVVSPNLEKIQSKGGLDDVLSQLLLYCEENTIPIVFALGRRALGRACGKFVPVSIVGIFDYSGVDEKYHNMIGAVQDARDRYQKLVNTVARDIDTQKERVAVERQAKVDEEFEAEKAVATKSVTSEETMENESEADNISRAMSRELIDKIKSERQSFQCHSRNVSAQSAFSVCSLVSQTQSDRDWREMAGDVEPEATNGEQQQEQQQEKSKTEKTDNNNEIE